MTAVPPRPAAPEVCRCGHAQDRHQPFIHEHQDACAGGTPGFCGCSGYIPAAPDATAGDGLREDLIRYLFSRAITADVADGILALPALRDVLAAAARDAEKVRRVEDEIAEEVAYAEEYPSWEITVTVPKVAGVDAFERIYEAVGDAAFETQPEDRTDWDVFVASSGQHESVPVHLLRRALDGTS